jgi:hypothetical protein
MCRTPEWITGQNYQNLEIIIAGNCSPGPKTLPMVEEFQKNDSCFQYFRQDKNRSPTGNFALVPTKAKGETQE